MDRSLAQTCYLTAKKLAVVSTELQTLRKDTGYATALSTAAQNKTSRVANQARDLTQFVSDVVSYGENTDRVLAFSPSAVAFVHLLNHLVNNTGMPFPKELIVSRQAPCNLYAAISELSTRYDHEDLARVIGREDGQLYANVVSFKYLSRRECEADGLLMQIPYVREILDEIDDYATSLRQQLTDLGANMLSKIFLLASERQHLHPQLKAAEARLVEQPPKVDFIRVSTVPKLAASSTEILESFDAEAAVSVFGSEAPSLFLINQPDVQATLERCAEEGLRFPVDWPYASPLWTVIHAGPRAEALSRLQYLDQQAVLRETLTESFVSRLSAERSAVKTAAPAASSVSV